ncbi:CAF1-domain-containing protein [Gonapodya prolifera JEL478]|uniref:CAF1-domain-containing protein n=1 Tax=Gonapodya prolifera (strain JEL478) TaxID=1344416 RepID=A0A138ZZ29_GONPJ|nr:CAF1-domain-containing protein [Gonapodya prolifera JEL478]|eukprot:KXS09741.1 CAF1-domain-containing protein [Gonapodya prolifera JEL478]
MEVTNDNFEEVFPQIEKAILEADVVAFDTELSGLADKKENVIDYWDSVRDRVEKCRKSSRSFALLQLGICCFTWEDGRYAARPFSIYVFPSTAASRSYHPDRNLLFQASSFSFLSLHKFDFNKWISKGVPYLSLDEDVTARRKWWKVKGLDLKDLVEVAGNGQSASQANANGGELPSSSNEASGPQATGSGSASASSPGHPDAAATQSHGPDLVPKGKDIPFLNAAIARVSRWSGIPADPPGDDPETVTDVDSLDPSVIVTCSNAYYRRLIHQEVRNRFGGRLKTSGAGGGVAVSRSESELAGPGAQEHKKKVLAKAREQLEEEMKTAGGVRRVLEVVAKRAQAVRDAAGAMVAAENGAVVAPEDEAEAPSDDGSGSRRILKKPRTRRKDGKDKANGSADDTPSSPNSNGTAVSPDTTNGEAPTPSDSDTPPTHSDTTASPPQPQPFVTTGHNCLLDVCHMVGKLWRDPSSAEEAKASIEQWKVVVNEALGNLVDTKHLASAHPSLKTAIQGGGTALGELFECVKRRTAFSGGAEIFFPPGFDILTDGKDQAHDAGYDAYMTGYAYIRFAEHMTRFDRLTKTKENPNPKDPPSRIVKPTDPLLAPFVSKLHLMRSDLGYINLVGTDPSRPTVVHVSGFHKDWNATDIETYLQKCGAVQPQVQKWLGEAECLARCEIESVAAVLEGAKARLDKGVKVVSWEEYDATRATPSQIALVSTMVDVAATPSADPKARKRSRSEADEDGDEIEESRRRSHDGGPKKKRKRGEMCGVM